MPKAGSNTFQISAYGERADRDRLFLIAEAHGVSQSQWVIDQIRSAFLALYGTEHPTKVLHQGGAAVLTDKEPSENEPQAS